MDTLLKIIVALIVLLVVIAGIWYFSYVQRTKGPVTETKEPVKVGAILPLSGTVSYVGEYVKEGLELAKDEINSQGGVDGRKLEIVYEDSQGDTQQGVTVYQKLVKTQGINILIPTISGVTLGIAPLAEQDKVLVFGVGTAAPKISEAGDYIFRHNLLPQTEAKVLADLIYTKEGFQEIGMLVVNSDSGVSYRDYFKPKFEELGGKIRTIEMYEKGTLDYRTPLTKIKAAEVEAVLVGGYAKELGFILKQAQELGLSVQWFSIYAAEEKEVLEIAGEAAEGLVYTHFFNPQSSLPVVKEYQEKYKTRYGRISETYGVLAYDNVRILALAMRKCENPEDATCIKNELYKIKDFPAVTGSITFDENGDTQKEIISKTVKNGRFVPYAEK